MACLLGLLCSGVVWAGEGAVAGGHIWQFTFNNDDLAASAGQFTSGTTLRRHSALASRLEDTRDTPAFGRPLAALVLPEDAALYYRASWSLAQNVQTPDDLGREDLILDDAPYAAMIGWANTFVAFDDRRFTGFEWMFGWLGEAALGAQVQTAAHDLTGAQDPKGWANQLANEPLLNVYYLEKRKLLRRRVFDVAVDAGVALGNFFTYGQSGLELRVGRLPEGFLPTPGPLGRVMDYDATIRRPGVAYSYASLVLRGTAFLHALPRDGNTFDDDNPWTERNVVDKEPLLGQLFVGLHHQRLRWGVHFAVSFSTDILEDRSTGVTLDQRNNFGSLTLEWRLGVDGRR